MGLIRRLLGIPTFQERLIERLLDENRDLRNRLLWKEGIPLIEVERAPEVSATERVHQAVASRKDAIILAAREAAADPELLAQAKDNAQYDPEWQDVVDRAEAMMEEVM